MKISHIVLIVIGTIAIASGSMAFGYHLAQQNIADEAEKESSSSQSASSGESNQNVLSVVGGDSNINPLTNDLPSPDGFSVYEQFANIESTQFQDIVEGNGQQAEIGDTVAMLYQGWLTNGQLFDQSRTNEAGELEPFVFEIGARQVIAGWDQGIVGMKVGGQRRLVIPASLGYGANGQGSIPPDSMLIFDVELIQLQKPPTSDLESGL